MHFQPGEGLIVVAFSVIMNLCVDLRFKFYYTGVVVLGSI